MKKILITGAGSYVGTSFEKYMAQWPDQYQVDTIDLIDGTWREKSFAGYDCVYHVAGIAHIKETEENAHLYFSIDRDLAVEVARKAKEDGVSQIVFPSSMSVYGIQEGLITRSTAPSPKTNYGRAKLEAEYGIHDLRDENFKAAIMRPPMVYGEGCRGNYQTMVKIAKFVPIFFNYENQRSMIHIDGLCAFVKKLIDEEQDGLFLPQDPEYINTCKMIQDIGRDMGKKVHLWKALNPILRMIIRCTNVGKKAFGNLMYAKGTEMEPAVCQGEAPVKKILITGANSYIGTSFEHYVEKWNGRYQVTTVDTVGGSWRKMNFSGYDCIFHVAGIAHSDGGHLDDSQKEIYYQINRDLAVEVAQKAKTDGVKQFIFMSSSIVYGTSAHVGERRAISADTPTNPANFYGDSKVQAEMGLLPLNDDSFKVVILRPPMIYGPGCKGNYPILAKLATKVPVFPVVDNQRSMLYIENLIEFVRLMVENEEQGIFWPQNAEYSNTTELVSLIAKAHGKKVTLIPGLTWLLKLVGHATALVDKAFGSMSYDMELSEYKENYRVRTLEESIAITEGKHEA